jgi:hypothetical protein
MATIKQTVKDGVSGASLGEHPITIWLITAVVIVWLYLMRTRDANQVVKAPEPAPKPKVNLKSGVPRGFPVLPSAGVDWSGRL